MAQMGPPFSLLVLDTRLPSSCHQDHEFSWFGNRSEAIADGNHEQDQGSS
jgi:hypothetical protein